MLVHTSYGQVEGDAPGGSNGGVGDALPSLDPYPFSAPGSGGVNPGTAISTGPPEFYKEIRMAHAVLGLLAFGLFFPLGSILIRLSSFRAAVWLHAAWQLFTLAMTVTTLGIGIRMAKDPTQAQNNFLSEPHTNIGLVTISLLLVLQPATGILHHKSFRRWGNRTAFSYAHILYGIPLITLGAINGGLGLQLSAEPLKYTVTYGVLAGVVWVLWMSATLISHTRRESSLYQDTTKTVSGKEIPVTNQSLSQRERRAKRRAGDERELSA